MTTIIIGDEAIRDLDDKALHAWLSKREAHLFQAWLLGEAARLAADAGNKLVEGTETSKVEAALSAEESRVFTKLADVISEMRNPEKNFATVTLKPPPIDTTT